VLTVTGEMKILIGFLGYGHRNIKKMANEMQMTGKVNPHLLSDISLLLNWRYLR
jgi:hypothetical protein